MEKTLFEFISKLTPENANSIAYIINFLFAICIVCFFRLNIIYDFIEKFSSREISIYRDLLTDPNVSEEAKKTLREKLDLIAYKKATKIPTNIWKQKKIIKYCELAKGKLSYSDFKKAHQFLKIDEDENLTIRKATAIERVFQQILPIILIILSFLLFFVSLFAFLYAPVSSLIRISFLLIAVAFLMMTLAFLFQASSIPTARKIKEEIDKNLLIIQYNERRIKEKRKILNNKELRPYGLCEGEFTVPDDFDDPLPEDILINFKNR